MGTESGKLSVSQIKYREAHGREGRELGRGTSRFELIESSLFFRQENQVCRGLD